MPVSPVNKTVFITGSTGYIGKRLARLLLQRGHRVLALTRKGSEHRVPAGCQAIVADPFNAATFRHLVPAGAVFVQLLGVPHPSPRKAQQFRDIDLRSVKTAAAVASVAGVQHFIYVSVAMAPSSLMAAYQSVRREGEAYCLQQQLNCSFLRPWYVLGPGHWWPLLLYPFYGLAELVPAWRKQARAKALVTIGQMLAALVSTVEQPPLPLRILEIRDIRRAGKI